MNELVTSKIYFCIDLRSFYASCECVERDLNPLEENLVVADVSRGKGALCLAVSYRLKKDGVKNRCRLFEIPKDKKYIIAKPQMKLYIDYAVRIYKLYQRYIAKEDIHVYSIDEMFLDVSKYLSLYRMDKEQFAKFLLKKIKEEIGLIATCGIGTNLYLAKIALDIYAKNESSGMYFLDENKYVKQLSEHEPITDFWMIANGIAKRLKNKFNISNLKGIREVDEALLYKEFGVDAELLIDHAYGKESVTMKDIKNYVPQAKSFSSSQILFKDYNYEDAKVVMLEMVNELSLRINKANKACRSISLYVGYASGLPLSNGGSKVLPIISQTYDRLKYFFLDLFDAKVDKSRLIRSIHLGLSSIYEENAITSNLFFSDEAALKEAKLEKTMNHIRDKFGKNSILRGINLLNNATGITRNKLIGGHASGEDA